MKKSIIISGGLFIILVTILFIIFSPFKQTITEYNKVEVSQKFENQESFLLVFGNSLCQDCTNFKKTTLVDYNKQNPDYPLVFIYTDKGNFLGSEDLSNFLVSYGIKLNSTPSTYLVINGKIKNQIEGPINLKELEKFIEENKK